MGKVKQEPAAEGAESGGAAAGDSYEAKVAACSVIAQPMAPRKLSKKLYKLIKKCSAHKTHLRNGLKIVQKQLRLGEKGIVVFAGDISPVEIMCHLPAVCEERQVPYCYTPSRRDIGAAMGTARGCIMLLLKQHPDYQQLYEEVEREISTLGHPL